MNQVGKLAAGLFTPMGFTPVGSHVSRPCPCSVVTGPHVESCCLLTVLRDLNCLQKFTQACSKEYGEHLTLSKVAQSLGKERPKIALVSHLDTVYSAKERQDADFSWQEKGSFIYGPGTMDCHGGTLGICMTLAGLQWLNPSAYESVDWHVLLNAAEEEVGVRPRSVQTTPRLGKHIASRIGVAILKHSTPPPLASCRQTSLA